MGRGLLRVLRIAGGFALVGAALAVIVFEQMAGASAGAVVNARLTTLQAPIAGTLELSGQTLGARVRQGEEVASIANPRADTRRLEDLEMEKMAVLARKERLRDEIAAIDDTLTRLRDRASRYGQERAAQLRARLAAVEAQRDAAEVRFDVARAERERAKRLHGRGVATVASLEEVRADAEIAERRIAELEAEREMLERELAAARSGIFLGDGPNDAPFSEQQASRLALRREQLVAEREETARAIRSLQSRILKEQRRINRLRHTVIRANVTGQVWEILASAGEHVHSGQDLLRILNCNSVIVTASVRENVYNDLGLGDTAWFRLNGMTLVFEGTVSRLAGQSASAVYSNLAVAPTDRHLERFDVKLHVPSLADHPEYGCAVGKTGRVFFTRRPLDGLRDTLSSLWS